MLKPGGVYFFDTINRTPISWLVMIKLFQDWRATRWMPPDLHDYRQFIKPGELLPLLAGHGLRYEQLVGLKPSAGPIRLIRLLRQLRRGEITPAELGRRSPFVISRDRSVLYAGYALRSAR